MKSLSEFPAPVIEKQSATFLTWFPLNKMRPKKERKGRLQACDWSVDTDTVLLLVETETMMLRVETDGDG